MRRLALLLLATPALAQAQAPACPQAMTVPGFVGWSAPAGSALAVGAPAALTLAPAAGQTFAPPLARAPAPGSYGGSFALAIDKAGTYRIALSAGAWIDVVAAGARLTSAAHEHGPDCSGIAKIVDFALTPGRYTVQLSAVKAPAIRAMVIAR